MVNNSCDILSIVDSLRGEMSPDVALNLIFVTAYIKYKDRNSFQMLLNVEKMSLVEEFGQVTNSVFIDNPLLSGGLYFEAGADSLAKLLIGVSRLNDFGLFSQEYRQVAHNLLAPRGCEHSSNANEVSLIKALVGDAKDKTVCDYAAGFAATISLLNVKQMMLQDVNASSAQMASILLEMAGKDFIYRIENSLEKPRFSKGCCDLVVMSPSLGMRLSSTEKIQNQPYLLPDISSKLPTSGVDSLWLQLALYSLNKTGSAYVTLAPGWLFRGGYDAKIREYLLKHGLIERIVMLPHGYFSHTGIQGALIVLRRQRPKGEFITLVDGRDFGEKVGRGVHLSAEDVSMMSGDASDAKFFRKVPLSEVRENKCSLSFSLYFRKVIDKVELNPGLELDKLAELMKKQALSQRILEQLLGKSEF